MNVNLEYPDIPAPPPATVMPTTRRFTETAVNENVDRKGMKFIGDKSLLKVPPLANPPEVSSVEDYLYA